MKKEKEGGVIFSGTFGVQRRWRISIRLAPPEPSSQ